MTRAEPRYAIYYAPAPFSPLDTFGRAWLGSAETPSLKMPGFTASRLAEIVASARHYGFHATLKPPFALAPGRTKDDLDEALTRFAAGQPPFAAPPLALASLDGFLALMLSAPSAAMTALAERCVRDFDAFRAPPSEAELAQRRRAGLTPLQDELLERWGYPYVMTEFRFHMTLSSRLEPAEREALKRNLAPLVTPLCAAPLPTDAVTLFVQPDRTAPFRTLRRYAFGGSTA
jgi:putative phosphonate metabolism protein